MGEHTKYQIEYIESVDGCAHQSAVDISGALEQQRDMLLEVLKQYADRQNWGYYDDSGCDKGHGEYTDACFIGLEVAQAAIAAVEEEK